MKNISLNTTAVLAYLILGGLLLAPGCDLGTYGRRMKDKAKPVPAADAPVSVGDLLSHRRMTAQADEYFWSKNASLIGKNIEYQAFFEFCNSATILPPKSESVDSDYAAQFAVRHWLRSKM